MCPGHNRHPLLLKPSSLKYQKATILAYTNAIPLVWQTARSFLQTKLHHDITIMHTARWLGELSDEEEKETHDRLHWQGRTTGILLVRDMVRRFEHDRWMRDWVAKGMDSNVTVLVLRKERVGKGESLRKARYGPAMLDMVYLDDHRSWTM